VKPLAHVLVLLGALSGSGWGQELTGESYDRWKQYLLPKPDELKWREIPWHTSFWSAVVEAQQKDKPILLWAMNGHPLACT
jgi:hypothetical protein